MRENNLIASLRDTLHRRDPSVLLGVGPDDCAHVRSDGRLLSMSVDAFVEGSHFLPDARPEDVAYKSLAASLSDLAASGCRARWALVALCLRSGRPAGWADAFATGLAGAANEFGVSIVGGDTVAAESGTFVSVTVVGEPMEGGPILRKGARPGDALVVTGELGGSILGKHLRPTPRLREMAFLMDFCRERSSMPTAAMDISDGLALDLSRLSAESRVGAVVDGPRVPVSRAAREISEAWGGLPLDHALADGEDFELLATLPAPLWLELEEYAATPEGEAAMAGLARFTRIGETTKGPGLFLRDADGATRPLDPKGYEHQW